MDWKRYKNYLFRVDSYNNEDTYSEIDIEFRLKKAKDIDRYNYYEIGINSTAMSCGIKTVENIGDLVYVCGEDSAEVLYMMLCEANEYLSDVFCIDLAEDSLSFRVPILLASHVDDFICGIEDYPCITTHIDNYWVNPNSDNTIGLIVFDMVKAMNLVEQHLESLKEKA